MIDAIITTYNSSTTIAKCIKSIPRELFGHAVRLILCDDCSTDSTVDIVQELIAVDDILFVHDKNKGVSSNRNKGLELSDSEFFLFVDSDDIFASNIFQSSNLIDLDEIDLTVFKREIPSRLSRTETLNKKLRQSALDRVQPIKSLFEVFQEQNEFLNECWGYLFRRSLVTAHQIQFGDVSIFEDVLFMTSYISVCSTWSFSENCLYKKSAGLGISREVSPFHTLSIILIFARMIDLASSSEKAVLFPGYFKDALNCLLECSAIYLWCTNISINELIMENDYLNNISESFILDIESIIYRLKSFYSSLVSQNLNGAFIAVWQSSPLSIEICRRLLQDLDLKDVAIVDDARFGNTIQLSSKKTLNIISFDDITRLRAKSKLIFLIASLNESLSLRLFHRSASLDQSQCHRL